MLFEDAAGVLDSKRPMDFGAVAIAPVFPGEQL
jgi:hypothetical protein